MYCKHCGGEISEESDFCRHCGESLTTTENNTDNNTNTNDQADEYNNSEPKFPITSVFVSILLLWVAIDVANLESVIIFAIPGIIIIPRIRRYVRRKTNEQYGVDLTSSKTKATVAVVYAILIVMAVALVIGSTNNSPSISGTATRQLTVSILTIGTMYFIAVVIVTSIRVNRKLQN